MTTRYAVEGFWLGLLFPVGATFLDSVVKGRGFWDSQREEPLLWIIDIAPIILSVTVAFIGKWRSQTEETLEEIKRFNEELQTTNQELIASRAIKSQFMANVSHEFRTPLNAIIGFARMTLLKTKDIIPERQAVNLQRIQDAGTSLLYLVNDILDIERLEAGALRIYETEVDLVRLFSEVEGLTIPMATAKNLELIFEKPEISYLWIDGARLRQIITNLTVNALKYSDAGTIRVRAFNSDNKFIISVEDEGIGIGEKEQGSIFEAFQQVDGSSTRSREGVGLGLNLVKKITTLMKGDVSVQSEKGVGSTFKVVFPLNIKSTSSRSGLQNTAFENTISMSGRTMSISKNGSMEAE